MFKYVFIPIVFMFLMSCSTYVPVPKTVAKQPRAEESIQLKEDTNSQEKVSPTQKEIKISKAEFILEPIVEDKNTVDSTVSKRQETKQTNKKTQTKSTNPRSKLAKDTIKTKVQPKKISISTKKQPGVQTPIEMWAKVLDQYVDANGMVDFEGLAKKPEMLNGYIEYISRVGPKTAPEKFARREAKLAHYINAYNALAMYNILFFKQPKDLFGTYIKARFFYFTKFKIDGDYISLYSYENNIIRALGEERVHFALNCMSYGCPVLPRKPFTAKNLNEELEREAKKFFSESRNLQILPEKKIVRTSEILKFFTKDFLQKAPSLIHYINGYREPRIIGDYKVVFIPYDWTVTSQKSTKLRQ